MSLERKDIRSSLDPDVYEMLEVLLEIDGITQSKFIEQIIEPVIRKRIHDATVIAARAALIGESRRSPESTGGFRRTPEDAGEPGRDREERRGSPRGRR